MTPTPAFAPQYILQSELTNYGLPTPDVEPDIMTLVQLASVIIDEQCGRIDGDGNGSLVYTTYLNRCILGTRNRNLIECPMKPIVGLSAATVANLQAVAAASGNFCYTGVQANTLNNFTGYLSGIVGASGRYGYTRQDMSIAYPDLFAMINPLNLITMFGGPAPWVPLDITQIDYDHKTGEMWLPAGLQLQKYSEVLLIYNSGFNPLQMPWAIKMVCAAIVKNALAKGDGTTGLMSMSLRDSGFNATFQANLLDPTLDLLLTPYRNVRSY